MTPLAQDRPLAGIAFNLTAAFLFSVENLLMKLLGADYPLMQIVLVRSLAALVPILFMLHRDGALNLAGVSTRRPWANALRLVLGMGSMLLYYTGLMRLPLADAVAISFSAPLFMTLLSLPILGEKVGILRWAAVVMGFAGVVVMVRPGAGMVESGAFILVLASVLYASSMTATRLLGATESGPKIALYSNVVFALAGTLCMTTRWETPPMADLGLMMLVGLIAGLAQLALIHAYRVAPIAVVSPFDYTMLIWATILGFLFYDELPGVTVALGALIVVGSGLTILFHERRAARGAGQRT